MGTTLKHELEIRGISDVKMDIKGIAQGGSLIPMCIELPSYEVSEVLFCENISGGKDEIDTMPLQL